MQMFDMMSCKYETMHQSFTKKVERCERSFIVTRFLCMIKYTILRQSRFTTPDSDAII